MTDPTRIEADVPLQSAETAAQSIPKDAVIATSGFGSVGYPKAVPIALAEDGSDRLVTVLTGGSVGEEIDTRLVEAGMMVRRYPYLGTDVVRDAVNDGHVAFHDKHISRIADEVQFQKFGEIDVALIEAVAIGEDWLVPSPCIGQTPAYVEAADRLIVEVNDAQPRELKQIHDIYRPGKPPNREPNPLTDPTGRIGDGRIQFDPDTLKAVVETDRRDSTYTFRDPTETDTAIAENVQAFLTKVIRNNPMFEETIRLQFGVGSLGNAIASALRDVDSADRELVYYGEVIQDGVLELLDNDVLAGASASSLALSRTGQERFLQNIHRYVDDIVLRPSEISNAPELIERFAVIAINSALEVDLYGHVNSTHVNGTHVINGIGGSGDFNRSAIISVVALPSSVRDGEISRIVPMVPHVDHTEHDVDVVVTERGIADLRGKSPEERATRLVEIAHPNVRGDLMSYLDSAKKYGGHILHNLENALDWPRNRQQKE